MSYVNTLDLLKHARKGNYAVGAFNIENMEMAQAVIEAAEEMEAPVILQTTPTTVCYGSAELFQSIVKSLAKQASIPVALHLDHGNSKELCVRAIKAGYSSIMIDGSTMPFEKNIALSSKVKQQAIFSNIPVEAELGCVGGKEDNHEVKGKDANLTDPNQAKEFVNRTEIDFLAVAVGTAHGFYKGEPTIDFKRLEEIREVVDIPLVLHGASGVPDFMVQQAVERGICKVNFATELRVAFTRGVRFVLQEEAVYDVKRYGMQGREEVKKLVKHKILICGCNKKY